jgi:hypothetical protein
MSGKFCLNADFYVTFRDLLHAVKLRHGTDGFTAPPKEGVLRIFSTKKIPTSSAGCEPANLDTSRTPKLLTPDDGHEDARNMLSCNSPLRTLRPIFRTDVPLPSRCCILCIFFNKYK